MRLRCRKCKKDYQIFEGEDLSCPFCGHEPSGWQKWRSDRTKQKKLAWYGVTLGIPFLTILTGQLIIGGTLLTFIFSGFLFISAFSMDLSNLEHPRLTRGISLASAIVFFLAGVGLFIWIFNGAPIPSWDEMQPVFPIEALIAMGFFAVMALIGRLLNTLLEKILKNRLKKTKEAGPVFHIPPYFRTQLLAVIIILLPIEIILPIAWVIGHNQEVDSGIGLVLPLVMLPVLLFPLLFTWYNFGAVQLTSQGVTRYYLIGKKSMRYSDIKRIKTNVLGLPMALALRSSKRQIKFPTTISGYPQILKTVRAYTQLSTIKPTKNKKQKAKQPLHFPVVLTTSTTRFTLEIISFILLCFIFFGLSTLGLWIPLFKGHIPPFTFNDLLGILLIFVLSNLIFIPVLIMLFLQSFGPKSLKKITLRKDAMIFEHPFGKKETFQIQSLERVWLQPVRQRVRGRSGGVVVSGTTTIYEFRLKFQGRDEMTLKRISIALLGTTPEALFEIFERLYPNTV
jgi:hypothetical protein